MPGKEFGLSAADSRLELSFRKWQWSKMEGEERNTLREALAGCWGLRVEARFRLYKAVVLTFYLWLLNSYMPEKHGWGFALWTLLGEVASGSQIWR